MLANGTVPLAMAWLYRVSMILGSRTAMRRSLFGFIASVAAITADKFASEIGMLDGMPVSLLTGRKVRKGVSGGVTWLGLTVSAIAAAMVGAILVVLIGPAIPIGPYLAICAVTLSGFLGNLADSLSGYYEEKGIGNKFTSNLLCSAAGAIIGALLAVLI